MTKPPEGFQDEYGRVKHPILLILISLAGGDKYGAEITRDIEAFAGIVLGPGTLYGALQRLIEQQLVETTPLNGRQWLYHLTHKGLTEMSAQLVSIQTYITVGFQRMEEVGSPPNSE